MSSDAAPPTDASAAKAAAAATATEPEPKKQKLSATEELKQTLQLLGQRKEEFVDSSPDAQRAAFFKAVIAKINARKPIETRIKLFSPKSYTNGDFTWEQVCDHKQFIADIMELRGWKMVDFGPDCIAFELKSMHGDARKLASELGWI